MRPIFSPDTFIPDMRKKYFTLIAGITLLVPLIYDPDALLYATGATHAVEPVITENQAVQRALKYSRKLQTMNTNVDIADYRHRSSGWISNPELRISEVSTRYYTDEFDELRLGLRWRFPDLGELGEERQEATVRLWDKKVDAVRYRQQLIAKIRKDYAQVLMYDQMADLARQQVEKENERIKLVEQLVSLGDRSVVYFTKAKIWHAQSRNDLARALQKQSLARRNLARRTDLSETMNILENSASLRL